MAKTMQNVKTAEVKRISNQEAKKMFQSKKWKYIGKYQGKRITEENNQSKGV